MRSYISGRSASAFSSDRVLAKPACAGVVLHSSGARTVCPESIEELTANEICGNAWVMTLFTERAPEIGNRL